MLPTLFAHGGEGLHVHPETVAALAALVALVVLATARAFLRR